MFKLWPMALVRSKLVWMANTAWPLRILSPFSVLSLLLLTLLIARGFEGFSDIHFSLHRAEGGALERLWVLCTELTMNECIFKWY